MRRHLKFVLAGGNAVWVLIITILFHTDPSVARYSSAIGSTEFDNKNRCQTARESRNEAYRRQRDGGGPGEERSGRDKKPYGSDCIRNLRRKVMATMPCSNASMVPGTAAWARGLTVLVA
jgi:hypothetical protein